MPPLDALLAPLTFAAIFGCLLIAGVFFAFSNFVMRALARIDPAAGLAAMQSINVVVLNSFFLLVFLGTAAVCAALVALAVWLKPPGAVELAAGGVLYLVGTFLVTVAFNVPRNEALARIDPAGPEAPAFWRGYVAGWTRWNHLRTLAALAAAVLFQFALSRISGP